MTTRAQKQQKKHNPGQALQLSCRNENDSKMTEKQTDVKMNRTMKRHIQEKKKKKTYLK